MLEEWLGKMRRWCSIQERSDWDVRQKLKRLGASEDEVGQVIEALTSENYLSEKRFLEAYVRTHIEHKRWGPARIVNGLIAKGFSSSKAWEVTRNWSHDDFERALQSLIRKRSGELESERERVIRFLLNKGFSLEAILKCIDAERTR